MNIDTKKHKKVLSTLINKIAGRDICTKQDSFKRLFKVTDSWAMSNLERLNKQQFKYSKFLPNIIDALTNLGLQENILPTAARYQAAVILGTTAPSHYKLWKDLVSLVVNKQIQIDAIILLGGDRKIHPVYDSMQSVYSRYPDDFAKKLTDNEIRSCTNEMQLMNKLSNTLILPIKIQRIPRFSIFTERQPLNKNQTNTQETLEHLKKKHQFNVDLPILFLGTLPHILRQGLQAQKLFVGKKIDISSEYKPFYETIDTPYEGKLPADLYLDELHWLINNLAVEEEKLKKIPYHEFLMKS